jgi:PAS domain S-box-containing protein
VPSDATEAALLRTMMESSSDPVFSVDAQYRYTSFNSAHASVMKALYGADIKVGCGLLESQTVPEDRETARANLDRALSGERVVATALSGEDARSRRCYEVTHEPVADAAGAVCGVLVTARDVTDRHRDREAVALRERALESSINAIAIADMDGVLTHVNRAFLQMWGFEDRRDVLGRPAVDFWESTTDAADVRMAMLEAGHWTGELTARRRDGSSFIAQLTTSLVLDDDGAPFGALAAFIDITEHKRAEAAFHDAGEMLALAQRSASAGVWDWDMDSGELHWSPELLELFGLQPGAEPSFDAWRAALHPDDREVAEACTQEAIQRHKALHNEYRIVRPGGAEAWIEALGSVLYDGDGEPRRMSGICIDITARRRAEEALRDSETHLRAFFERASVGMATTSPEKGWIEVNDALCEMLGYSREELAGLTWAELTHPDDLAPDVAQFARVMRGEIDGYGLDKRFLRKDGSVLHTHLVVHAVREPGRPGFDYLAAMLEDVGERVRAEDEVRRLNAELEQRVELRTAQLLAANRELEAFAYSISHDLRAPLRALDGFSEILVEDYGDVLDESGLEHLHRVRAAAQRMGHLIDALLSLFRLTRRDLLVTEVDLSAIAETVTVRLREAYPERIVEVRVLPGCCASTDAQLAEALISNLLDDAWKFTAGCDEAHIEFGCTEVDGECAFFVSDDGAGFEMAYADKLFQPFQRLHAAEDFPGTGIGLASVRRIVTRLGGRCWAEGEMGRGASFFFTLGTPVE